MKNERTPRTLSESVFRTGYPDAIPTRRSRVLRTVVGAAIILVLVLYWAWAITGDWQ